VATGSSASRQDSEQTRQRILDVSQRLFASRGYDGTGVEHIARQAHIARSLLYYYFKNKEGILQAILERHAQRSRQQRLEPGAGIEASLDSIEANGEVIRIILMEALKEPGSERVLMHLEPLMAAALEGGETGLNTMFLRLLPLATFALLRDRWCELTGADPSWARAQFLATYSELHPAAGERRA